MARELGEAGADSDADPALDDLHWAYRSGNLIFFVGAGISTAAGLPSRSALVGRLIARAKALGAAEDRLAEVQALADKQRIIDAISLVHGILDPAEIAAIVERDLDDQAADKLPDLALAIGALRPGVRAVITTNLDHLLERALGGAWPALSRVTADIAQRRRFILKLNGTLTLRSSWILTRDDLALAPHEDERRRQALAALFNESALLFIGYSVADDDFDNILTRLRAIAGPEPPRHFALVPADGVTPYRRDRLERSGVRPIPYDNSAGDHREVVHLLRRLARGGGGATEEHISLNPAPVSGEVVRRASDSPFPGLTPFDRADARFFFGRDAEIAEATRRLGDTPEGQRRWLSIEGPSGVGKSSLARAGVTPAIVEKGWAFGAPDVWRVAVIRPGSDPVLTLSHSVHAALKDRIPAEGRQPAATAASFRAQPGALSAFLREHTPKGTGLLLVIDQLEELFTTAEPGARAALDAALARAISDAGGPLYLITTLSADFAAKMRDLPDLAAIFNTDAVRLDLAEMRRPALRAAIEGPARLADLTWERDLAARILDDAMAVKAPLPLLAHVLHALWIRRQESTLGQGAYDALGGVAGALPKIADALLEGLGKDGRDRAQRLLLALVRITADGASLQALTRSEAVLAAGGGDKGERVLTRLLGERDPRKPQGAEAPVRLLSASRIREDEVDRVEICHEILLERWGTLKKWVDERQGQLLRQDKAAAGAAPTRGAPRGWRATAILTAVSVSAAMLGGLAAVSLRQRAEAVHARERAERDLSISENKLGDLAQARGDVAAAREYFEAALTLREALARAAPGDTDLQVDLALSHGRVASAAREAKDQEAFQTHWKAAKAILDRLGLEKGAVENVKLSQAREWIDRIGN